MIYAQSILQSVPLVIPEEFENIRYEVAHGAY
jgi:hypothetical protein